MMQNNTIVIGLTGGIGCGKSTISNMFINKGIPVIDADKISREVLITYPEILEKIKADFGEEFFDEKGNLLRKKLGSYVFSKKILKEKLENIIIPYVKKEIFDKIKKCKENNCKLCVLDAPTLIENNLQKNVDYVLLVVADENIQIQRVMDRDNLSEEEVLKRINSQTSLKERLYYAHYIIDNSKSISKSEIQLKNIISDILSRGKNEKS